jgi:glycerol-3-phosphate dehydrogenase (NAD(P)+)
VSAPPASSSSPSSSPPSRSARTRVAVLGAGSWGTTYAKVLADAGTPTVLWGRRPELVAAIRDRHENPDYLPGVRLPAELRVTADAAEALAGAQAVVLAVPSQTLRENLSRWAGAIGADALVVSLMKGVELGSDLLMSQVITEVAQVEPDRVVVVSGPNLAGEIAAGQPAATVVASTCHEAACWLQAASRTSYFRPYTNSDVVGCELGGAVKNVIALACGIADGMGFGENTRASLITRGLAETARLGEALGANPLTFAGLAGLGDLVATCTSKLSRNRSFGECLGRGEDVTAATARIQQTAEGVKSCRGILDLGHRHGIDMPITEQVVAAVHEGLAPAQLVANLMRRESGAELPQDVPLRHGFGPARHDG